MKVTYNWLKEFIDLDLPPGDLIESFENLGIEVEDFRDLSEGLKSRVVVGEIVEIKSHPRRPGWKVIRVDVGERKVVSVSGAPNLELWGKVVYGLPGTILPDGTKISEKELLGIKSFGMPLSEEDLGAPIESEGVINLPQGLEVGSSPLPYLLLNDWLYDLYITPNRPDLLSVMGLARELHVKLGIPYREIDPTVVEKKQVGTFPVFVEAPEGCPRYTARLVRNIKVGDSPPRIRYRLSWCGIRPINSIVDITNYVLLEMGQPIHAFDLSKIKNEIWVRFARRGEKIITLDGVERTLDENVLVIADEEKPVAIAGIMGGEESGVTGETKDILIESAYFDPVVIRKGISTLGLTSESSFRFARGTDAAMPPLASSRVAQLVKEISGGEVGPLVDVSYVKSFTKRLRLRKEKVDDLLGVKIPTPEIKRILISLGFDVSTSRRGRKVTFTVNVPVRRVDIEWEADLIEEIARFYGYEKIPETLSTGGSFTGKRPPSLRDIIRGLMMEIGFTETIGLDFVSKEDLEAIGVSPEKDAVRIKNPLGEPYAYMRTHLFLPLVQTVSTNLKRGNLELRLFEVGNVFLWKGTEKLPEEPLHLAALVAGEKILSWREKERDLDFYDLKGALDHLAKRLNLEIEVVKGQHPFLENGGTVRLGKTEVGWIGEFTHEFLKRYEIKTRVYGFEISLEKIKIERSKYRPLPKFPPVKRDISLLVPREMPFSEVEKRIGEARIPFLKETRLIDLYQGKPLPEDKKSMTFSLLFQNPEATLKDREVDELMEKLISHLYRFGLQVRGIDNAS